MNEKEKQKKTAKLIEQLHSAKEAKITSALEELENQAAQRLSFLLCFY